jgi:alcohol dehydrogenase (cytochrome c)
MQVAAAIIPQGPVNTNRIRQKSMHGTGWSKATAGLVGGVFCLAGLDTGAWAQISAGYAAAQAAAGKMAYQTSCASCHGNGLDDGQFAPTLKGADFLSQWGARPVSELLDFITEQMPKGAPNSLSANDYQNIVAYIMQANLIYPTSDPLTPKTAAEMLLPARSGKGTAVVAAGIKMPPDPYPAINPLSNISPVTEAMLASPAQSDWLSWRRTRDASGYSPLTQINKSNIKNLAPIWSWALPVGPAEATPLVHDGVLFVIGYRDVIQAFNAASGDLLWQYTRRLPQGANPSVKKGLAILADRLYSGTSDGHMIALDVKTGNLVWDTDLSQEPGIRVSTDSGPIVAKGNVIIGTRGGHPVIVALNAQTGKEVWRFGTIAKEGKEGDTWNGVPYEKRSGGTVWEPGSYDDRSNLVYFGVAQTYDTGPLAKRAAGKNNDALYTDATLALNPETGKLVWYFQHVPNDQWDHDWAFERILFTAGGRRLVATAGKEGLYDVLEAGTGKYQYSFDPGLQNVILSVDSRTGAKTINSETLAGDGKNHFVCPATAGAKNFMPASYNPATHVMVTQLTEVCADFVPVGEGERGFLSTGIRQNMRPRPDSDGLYGRLEAFDLTTGKSLWKSRQRGSFQTGVLAVNGLVFAGSIDREFAAYDDADGRRLWHVRLSEASNGSPIAYSVNGKEYIALVTGTGDTHSADFDNLYPEIKNQPARTETLWVFSLSPN